MVDNVLHTCALFALMVVCVAIKLKNCDPPAAGAVVYKWSIGGCDDLPEGGICQLHTGTEVPLTVEFTPNKTWKNFTIFIGAKVLGLLVGLPEFDGDGCPHTTPPCSKPPLTPNQTYTYSNNIYLEQFFPEIRVELFIKIQRELRHIETQKIVLRDMACGWADAQVVKPEKKY